MNDDIVITEEYKEHTIHLRIDEDALCNPREMGMCFTNLYFTSNRYVSGDFHISEFEDNEENYSFPVYAYIHSGILFSLAPFSCPWDSGQIGIIEVTPKALKAVGFENKLLESAKELCNQELQTYQDYVNGQIYNVEVVDKSGDVVDVVGEVYDSQDPIQVGKEMVDEHIKNKPIQLELELNTK